MNSFFRRLQQRSLTSFFTGITVALLSVFLMVSSWAIAPQALALTADSAPTETTDSPTAATLFELNCAGCHANGGNIIRRGKNLKQRAMLRNGYGDVDAIAQIITNGKGIMSAYSDRLNETEIGAIAQYVHEQSETGW